MESSITASDSSSIEANITAANGDIPFIPLHVVEEILLSLDSQTLFQSSLVCKDWNELVTSSDFICRNADQTFGSRNQILLIRACPCESLQMNGREYIYFPRCQLTFSLHRDNDEFDFLHTIESPTIEDFKDTEVIGVSNGLVCLAKKSPFMNFILWNPTIRRYASLPQTVTWEQSGSLFSLGFGFDHNNNDFKVLNIVYRRLGVGNSQEFDSAWIFSYATWSWKCLTCDILRSCSIRRGTPNVFFNGSLHWIVWHREEEYYFILTYNLTREVFGKILLPDGARPYAYHNIVTNGDSLLLIQEMQDDVIDGAVSYFFSIWIMKQSGDHVSWTNACSTTTTLDTFYFLAARKNGELIVEMEGEPIRRYNPATSTNVVVGAIENSVFFRYHNESLYLLEKGESVHSY